MVKEEKSKQDICHTIHDDKHLNYLTITIHLSLADWGRTQTTPIILGYFSKVFENLPSMRGCYTFGMKLYREAVFKCSTHIFKKKQSMTKWAEIW